MMPSNVRRPAGGTVLPSLHLSRHFSPLWWLLVILAAGLALLFAFPAHGATVSGEVAIPVSEGGYQPAIFNSTPAKVRVEGTSLEANVVATTIFGTRRCAAAPRMDLRKTSPPTAARPPAPTRRRPGTGGRSARGRPSTSRRRPGR